MVRDSENGKVGLGEILDSVADDAGFPREGVGVKIEALGHQTVIPPVEEETGASVNGIGAGGHDGRFSIGVESANENVFFSSIPEKLQAR